jgi:hypothetical protein
MSFANTRSNRPTRGVRRARAQALLADMTMGILAFFLLLCVGLITPALWAAIVERADPKPRACDTIKNPLERLACADTLKEGQRPVR